MRNKKSVRLPAYVTGSVNQETLPQNEYRAAENRILRSKLPSRLRLSDPERATLGEIGKRLGRRALREVACMANPDCGYRNFICTPRRFGPSAHIHPGTILRLPATAALYPSDRWRALGTASLLPRRIGEGSLSAREWAVVRHGRF